MDSQFLGAESEMYADDLFEGWLAVPSISHFFDQQSLSSIGSKPLPIMRATTPQNAGLYAIDVTSNSNEGQSYQSSTQSSPGVIEANPAVRKRRGHTKSRLGCVGCKKRKIKCQETWPACANCIKRGCPCRYPTVSKHTAQDRFISQTHTHPRSIVQLSDTPIATVYTANDMRLFHHFLVAAHPCIPMEYEPIWVGEIPRFSHQYEYLMHGILAIAGSHLDIFVGGAQQNHALAHRQKAIEGLEQAFTSWPPSAEEAHVMLATSYLLAFQSSYMPDAYLDHILSLRGCALISQLILRDRLEGAFNIEPDLHGTWFQWKVNNFPDLDQQLAHDALRSLSNFAPHLMSPRAHEIERAIAAQLVECIRPLLLPIQQNITTRSPSLDLTEASSDSPSTESEAMLFKHPLFPSNLATEFDEIKWDKIGDVPPGHHLDPGRAFNALMCTLLILCTWPQEAVLHLFSPTNTLGNVVMAHFCCVRFIVSPLAAPDAAMKVPIKAMIEWCEKVVDAVEDDVEVQWTKYIEWPQKILTTMRCCLNQKPGLTFGDLYDVLIKDPGAFRDGRLRRLSMV